MGAATLRLFDRAGRKHLTQVELHVRPDVRRRDTGTALQSAVVAEAASAGCRSLIAGVPACTPAELFCAASAAP